MNWGFVSEYKIQKFQAEQLSIELKEWRAKQGSYSIQVSEWVSGDTF